MKVRLRDLKPNPMRDFAIDPLDDAIIERLRASIRQNGFWGGVVARAKNGHFEIAAGQHRVDSGLLEGIEEAEIHVTDLDDRAMIRIYAEENATQRGSAHSTARAGSVAAALRQAAYDVLTGRFSEISENLPEVQGNAQNAKGIGAPLIEEHYLKGIPGIKRPTIEADLASLKASGEYARIMGEVRDRIEAERAEAEQQAVRARAAAEMMQTETERQAAQSIAHERQEEAEHATAAANRAEKAAEKSAAVKPTFDFQGVAAHLKTAHHLKSFRDVVTSDMVRPYLPMDQQGVLAQRLVGLVGEGELTALFIRTHIVELVAQIREEQNKLDKRQKELLLAADWSRRLEDLEFHYQGALRQVAGYGGKLLEHLKLAPPDPTKPVPGALRGEQQRAEEIMEKVKEGLL